MCTNNKDAHLFFCLFVSCFCCFFFPLASCTCCAAYADVSAVIHRCEPNTCFTADRPNSATSPQTWEEDRAAKAAASPTRHSSSAWTNQHIPRFIAARPTMFFQRGDACDWMRWKPITVPVGVRLTYISNKGKFSSGLFFLFLGRGINEVCSLILLPLPFQLCWRDILNAAL